MPNKNIENPEEIKIIKISGILDFLETPLTGNDCDENCCEMHCQQMVK